MQNWYPKDAISFISINHKHWSTSKTNIYWQQDLFKDQSTTHTFCRLVLLYQSHFVWESVFSCCSQVSLEWKTVFCQPVQTMQWNPNLIYYHARWRLCGHILCRSEKEIFQPTKQCIFFTKNQMHKNFRGKEWTSLPSTLTRDLDRIYTATFQDHTYYRKLKLRTLEDLEHLRTLAQAT